VRIAGREHSCGEGWYGFQLAFMGPDFEANEDMGAM